MATTSGRRVLGVTPANPEVLYILCGNLQQQGYSFQGIYKSINSGTEFTKSLKLAQKFKNVEILWASVREPYNYLQAKQVGCHIITAPPSIIEKIENFGKSFNVLSIETVKNFVIDSRKSRFIL